jgi:hypothetical protein
MKEDGSSIGASNTRFFVFDPAVTNRRARKEHAG